ncbi:MAG TPA: asparaginase [Candidatus Limnocylindrales bacterium]|nr:asparaginase [Candidatus Limnocylindrales bacterium]
MAVIFTGGTISMRVDPLAGGNVPALSGADILVRTPGLDAIAEVEPIDLGRTPASHFTFDGLFEIAAAIRSAQADPAIDGVVLVQGTDVIEETAFFWDLVLTDETPVVVTGAMRSASEPDDDGPANLRDAVGCAVDPRLRGQGVVVVLAGSIDAADDVTKTHATALDTFRSLNDGPLGSVGPGGVRISRGRGPRRHVAATSAATRVRLITAHVAMDGSLLDAAVEAGTDGLVIEATGAGNTTGSLLDAAIRAMGQGIPVVLTTRCPAGAAGAGYAFRGGGATWVRAGAMLAGTLTGPKARIALALGLGAGLEREVLAELLVGPGAAAPARVGGQA